MSINLLNNLYINLDKMPNLKEFNFHCHYFKETETFYKNLVKKILSLNNIKKINIIIKNKRRDKYLNEELINIFPNKQLVNYNEVNITKF